MHALSSNLTVVLTWLGHSISIFCLTSSVRQQIKFGFVIAKGQRLNPADPALYQAWALLEKEKGEYEKARQLFRAGLRMDRRHIYMWQVVNLYRHLLSPLDSGISPLGQGLEL